jgi:hypothetical protein
MMKRVLVLTLGFIFVALAVGVAVMAVQNETGFDATVHAIETRYHVHATRIPLMGFASAVARISTKGGVGNVNVVTFEDFKGPVDGAEFDALIEEKLGKNWKRMIRETHAKSYEQTLIYVRPEGDRMGLVVVDLEKNELDLVNVSVDPKHLKDEIANHTYGSHMKVGSHAEENDDKPVNIGNSSEDKASTAASE